jgi:hypothetical protein
MHLTRLKKGTLLVILLALANCVALTRVLYGRYASAPEPAELHAVRKYAAAGRIHLPDAAGRPVLILAADYWTDGLANLQVAVRSKRLSDIIVILVTSQTAGGTLDRLRSDVAAIVRVSDREVLNDAGLSGAGGRWIVFDRRHFKRASGDLVNDLPTGLIDASAHGGATFSGATVASYLSRVPQSLTGYAILASKASARVHLSLFVGTMASGCAAAEVLYALRDAHATHGASVSLTVPADWTEQDIENLRSTFELDVPVLRADMEATVTWRALEADFGPRAAGAFLVAFAPNGVTRVETTPLRAEGALADPGVLR